jgi:hypothetical protein
MMRHLSTRRLKSYEKMVAIIPWSEWMGIIQPYYVPDGDTIGRFRALLVKHGLQERMFAQVLNLLQARGLILRWFRTFTRFPPGEQYRGALPAIIYSINY